MTVEGVDVTDLRPRRRFAIVFNRSWLRSVRFENERIPRRSIRLVSVDDAPVLVLPAWLSLIHFCEASR